MNEGIERAHTEGALTQASLMVAEPWAADAVARARRLPGLNVGLHLVLVDGAPCLPAAEIPALVDHAGRFGRDQAARGVHYFFSPRARRALEAEIRAQFAAFARTGLALHHADSHKHMHLHPTVAALMIRIGRDYGLRRIRIPAEPPRVLRACGARPGLGAEALYRWAGLIRRMAGRAGLETAEHVFGIHWSGHMTPARVARLLSNLPPGRSELYFHPAARRDETLARLMPDYEHVAELQALLAAATRERATASAALMPSTPAERMPPA